MKSLDEIGPALQLADRMAAENRVDEAVDMLSELLTRFPTETAVLLRIGKILLEADRLADAVDVLTVIRAHLPGNAEVQRMLGIVLARMRRYAEAEGELQEAIRLEPTNLSGRIVLASVYDETGRADFAVEATQEALKVSRDDLRLTLFAVGLLYRSARSSEALDVLAQAPPNVTAYPEVAFTEALLMPVIPTGMEQIRERRAHLAHTLRELRKSQSRFSDPEAPIEITNFFLGYHGMRDLPLIRETAETVLAVAPGLGYVSPRLERKLVGERRLRVGFLSSNLRVHSVGRVLNRLLKELDRERFEVLLFELPGKFDAGQHVTRGYADNTVLLSRDLTSARRAVEAEEVDVLMFTDLPMDGFNDSLAYSRLAPVQCTTWGHPGTSGRPSIDYWVSCREWEPPGNERYYSEKLVRLSAPPMIATQLEAPDIPTSRADLGLPEGRLYGCPQSLYKLHPEFDSYLGEVLRRDPDSHVVLIGGLHGAWIETFKKRFAREYADEVDRLVFMRHTSTKDYLSMLTHFEVSLDPLHFSGANTSMEAWTVGLPVVGQPGSQLRNRQTLSFYRMMEFTDLMVESKEQYVDLALRIGTDPAYRAELSQIVRERCRVLFDTVGITRELEAFFETAAKEAIG